MVRRKRVILAVAILVSAAVLSAIMYRGRLFPPVSHPRKVTDYASFLDWLNSMGVDAKPAGKTTLPFFSAPAYTVLINREHLVMVFEYKDSAAAEAEAARVSPDGMSIGETRPSWGFTPHFYKAGRIIVLYVGDDEDVLNILESSLGPQFAGG
jgi:hypothetical protein